MNPREELKERTHFFEEIAKIRPISSLADHEKASIYRALSGQYFSLYVFNSALNGDIGYGKAALKKAEEMIELAVTVHPDTSLESMQGLLVIKLLLGEDILDVSQKIVSLAKQGVSDSVTPLYIISSCLFVDADTEPFMTLLTKHEKAKSQLVLPGAYKAVDLLKEESYEKLVIVIDEMLLVHHKQANNSRSAIYNSANSFFCQCCYLMLNIAKQKGMDIQDKITQNNKVLKLGLSSPADHQDLPKNYRMPIEVDYLTGKTNIVV